MGAGVKPCLPSVLRALLAMMVVPRMSKRSPEKSSEMSRGAPRVCHSIQLRFAMNTSLPLRSAIAHQVLYKWWDYNGMMLLGATVKRCQTIVLGTIRVKFWKKGVVERKILEEGRALRQRTEAKEE